MLKNNKKTKTMSKSSRDQILEVLGVGAAPEIEEHIDLNEIFVQVDKDNICEEYQKNLNALSGVCVICENNEDAKKHFVELKNENGWNSIVSFNEGLKNLFSDVVDFVEYNPNSIDFPQVSVTTCERLIARTGSVLVSTNIDTNRRAFSAPETHVVIAYVDQVALDLNIALRDLKDKYNGNLPAQITNITGPSRTSDIEKTLILGAHGPKNLIVFLIKNR